jgi:hypothetical protein
MIKDYNSNEDYNDNEDNEDCNNNKRLQYFKKNCSSVKVGIPLDRKEAFLWNTSNRARRHASITRSLDRNMPSFTMYTITQHIVTE